MLQRPLPSRKHRTLLVMVAVLIVSLVACRQETDNSYTFDLRQIARDTGTELDPESPAGGEAIILRSGPESSGLVLPGPEDAPWIEARYLVMDVWHDDQHSNIIQLHFFSADDHENPRITGRIGILPELLTRLTIPMEYLDGQTLFMARQPRQLKGTMPGSRLPLERLAKISATLLPAEEDFAAEVHIASMRLTDRTPEPLSGEEIIVDELGQWTARDWPDKTADEEEMVANLTDLHQQAGVADWPESWSSYGGWRDQAFEATGYFRTENDGNRWWLVDPEGYAFVSIGIDGMRPWSVGPIEGMESLHAWLPDEDGPYADAYFQDRGRNSFSFLTANLIRTFGEDWERHWQELARGMMIHWRFNTIANWSETSFMESAQMPFVLPLSNFPSTETRLYRDFPDVFSPEYRDNSRAYARQMEAYRENEYLIGYFLRNEPNWAFGANNLASEMLATDQASFTRSTLINWLATRYGNNIDALSDA